MPQRIRIQAASSAASSTDPVEASCLEEAPDDSRTSSRAASARCANTLQGIRKLGASIRSRGPVGGVRVMPRTTK